MVDGIIALCRKVLQLGLRRIRGELRDPTLSFQPGRGFLLTVAPGYLRHDPASLGDAAVNERLNPAAARHSRVNDSQIT